MASLTLRAGRYPKVDISAVRDLTHDDLAVLSQPRAKLRAAERFKDSHHRIARLFAAGLRHADVCAKTGYSEGRVSTLHADPSFQELIAGYRKQVDAAFVASVDDYFEVATSNMLKAERMLGDKLDEADEAGETLPTRDLIAISRDAADRFGYGKKQTNVNVNIDFAARLERARARASTKTIESSVVTSPIPPHSGAEATSFKVQPQPHSAPSSNGRTLAHMQGKVGSTPMAPTQPQRLTRRA